MTPKRLTAWRRRLGISPVLDKRLARLVQQVQREEREACAKVAGAAGVQLDDGAFSTQVRIVDAILRRKVER